MIKVYSYNRCSTCKKALKWLDENNIEYEVIDIKNENPNEEELFAYYNISKFPLKRFFNTSGIQYRQLQLAQKLSNMNEHQQIALLSSDGMLVKRPLVVADDFILLGFKESEWKVKLL